MSKEHELDPSKRGVARFDKKLERFSEQREAMLDQGKLSEAPGEGALAVMTSHMVDYARARNPQEKMQVEAEQISAFEEEAERLADERRGEHKDIIRLHASRTAIDQVLTDPQISDLILIGHGNIGALHLLGVGKYKYYDWQAAAKRADHLKQGKIEQRMCGHFPNFDSVPFGTFIVSDQRNVSAALNKKVADRDPDDALFVPVFEKVTQSMEEIRRLPIRFNRSWRHSDEYTSLQSHR